jgi:hypothetical protein
MSCILSDVTETFFGVQDTNFLRGVLTMKIKNIVVLNGLLLASLATSASAEMSHLIGQQDHQDLAGDFDGDHDRDHGRAIPPPHGPQGRVQQLVPLYRMFNGRDHFQTIDYQEGIRAGYRLEGQIQLFANVDRRNAAPLFRCNNSGYHFVSSSQGCEGAQSEGFLGYALARQTPGTVALYRCFGRGDHLSTVTPDECSRAGFQIEGIQGYVPR